MFDIRLQIDYFGEPEMRERRKEVEKIENRIGLRILERSKRSGLNFSIDEYLYHNGEFDPGSGRTLEVCLIHASRTDQRGLLF